MTTSFRAGVALLISLAGTFGALAVTITPVGPSDRMHRAAHINERGDILFDLDTVLGLDYQPGDAIPSAETWFADGTIRTLYNPGSLGAWAWLLGEDGTTGVYARYAVDSSDPFGDREHRLLLSAPDGSPIHYEGTPPFARFRQITGSGRFIGSASDSPYLASVEDFPPTPIIWSPTTGETQHLALPFGHTAGEAWRSNPAGGVTGFAWSDTESSFVWWGADNEVQATFPMRQLMQASPDGGYNVAGIDADGNLIASTTERLYSISPSGEMEARSAPEPSGVVVQLADANRDGIAVGITYDLNVSYAFPQAGLWLADGRKLDLQSLLPDDSPWLLTQAIDITDSGLVLVQAIDRNDHTRGQAFVISDIPTPATLVLSALALPMTLRRRRAR